MANSLAQAEIHGFELQLLNHSAEGSRGNFALQVLNGRPAVRADVQGSVAPFPVRGNPFAGQLPRSCRVPHSPQKLGTFHLSNIVHLCTKPSDLRPSSSLPAGRLRRAKTSTAVQGAASN